MDAKAVAALHWTLNLVDLEVEWGQDTLGGFDLVWFGGLTAQNRRRGEVDRK